MNETLKNEIHYRLGCDIGGTFTDFVNLNEQTGAFEISKVLTTPHDPSEGIDNGLVQIGERIPGSLEATNYIIHGTTLVINTLIQRQGAKTALVTTSGFRDIIAMRREMRYDTHDISARFPEPLVSREYRREVDERILSDGSVRTALNVEQAERVLDELVKDNVESVAVCFLHAYANPEHERQFAKIAEARHPNLSISLSSEVMPEIKEYERSSTTIINSYVKPMMNRYLERLGTRLEKRGYMRGLFLMLSGGGITSPAVARKFPIRLVESGPVGGALAAGYVGKRAGLKNVLSFDMGGTTAKACFVYDSQLPITVDYEVDRVHRFKRGSGTPVAVPTVDMIEIGAGGGSIAAINSFGVLEVGPQSAGADPGPICYGRGGTKPTITDADLVLGYLDANFFLGGAMKLDLDAARAGIERDVAQPLGLTVEQAAWGIHQIVNENMASAARIHITEKGGDIADTTVVAFGGAGPVHADGVARILGAKRMLFPRGAGVFSALGFLVAPVSFEVSKSVVRLLEEIDAAELNGFFTELEAEASAIVGDALPDHPINVHRVLDICYRGQGSALRVAVDGTESLQEIEKMFRTAYQARYGYSYDDLEAQIRALRVTAMAHHDLPTIVSPFLGKKGSVDEAFKGERLAYSQKARAFVAFKVYTVDLLGDGSILTGPAILEEEATTLVIDAGATAEADARGWVTITLEEQS